jgi:lysophospholipase L1-like esterase
VGKVLINIGFSFIMVILISTNNFAQCEGDFNNDGDLDGEDLNLITLEFGRTDCLTGPSCNGDIYPIGAPDGEVNEHDLAVFAADFGRTDCPIQPLTPLNLFNIGNSIGEGSAADGVIGSINHETVWSTGYDPEDIVFTLNERFQYIDPIGYYENDATRDSIFNRADEGDEMGDFVAQANEVVAAAAATPSGKVGMVTVFLGNNDVCTDEVGTMTNPGLFEMQYRAGLDVLAASNATKDAYIHVSGIPAIYWLWIAKRSSFWCRVLVWPRVPCQELLANPSVGCISEESDLDPDTDYAGDVEGSVCERRKIFHRAIRDDYNRILRDVLREYKENGLLPNAYYIDIFDIKFDDEHVNGGDCFHPSVEGHRVLAEEHWCRSPWNIDDQLCMP